MDTSGLIADATCDFTPTGQVDLDERYLEVKELQVNLVLCKQDFVDDWEAIQMGYSAFDKLPKDFQSYFIALMAGKVAEANEQDIWNGTEGAGSYDGLVTKMLADGNVIDIATPVAITAANVVDKLGEVVDAIPQEIYRKPDLMLYVSQGVYRSYIRALGGFGASGEGANGYQARGNNQAIGSVMFDGVQIAVAEGLTGSQIVAAQKSNLWFGTGLMSDWNKVQVIDTADTLGDQNVRFVMRFTADVNFGYGGEIVLYNA